jgi:beta-N-acetylhexosaminidase
MIPILIGIRSLPLCPSRIELFRRHTPAGYFVVPTTEVPPAAWRGLTDTLRSLSPEEPLIAWSDGRPDPWSALTGASSPLDSTVGGRDRVALARHGTLSSDLLRMLGFNTTFGPSLAFDRPASPPHRLISQDVIDEAGLWNRCHRRRDRVTIAGGFPGCHTTGTPRELLADEWLPYTALMPEIDGIQVSDRVYPALDAQRPATCSPRILQQLLRDQLGFDRHMIFTEDLGRRAQNEPETIIAAIESSLAAGADLPLISGPTGLIEGVLPRLGPPSVDFERRWKRLRKRFKHPLPWSEARCQTLVASLGPK